MWSFLTSAQSGIGRLPASSAECPCDPRFQADLWHPVRDLQPCRRDPEPRGRPSEEHVNVAELRAKTRDTPTAQRAFGEPIVLDGVTVIPVARISGGGGLGTSPTPPGSAGHDGADAGSGGGFGIGMTPVGVFSIRDGAVTWRPAFDLNRVILGGQLVGLVTVLVVRSCVKILERRGSASPRHPRPVGGGNAYRRHHVVRGSTRDGPHPPNTCVTRPRRRRCGRSSPRPPSGSPRTVAGPCASSSGPLSSARRGSCSARLPPCP